MYFQPQITRYAHSMEKIQNDFNPMPAIEQAELSLLDILVTLAENARLLIVGPLLVGLSALGIGYVLPQTFQSVAVLQAEQSGPVMTTAAAATASLMTSAAVLDPVVAKLGLYKAESAAEARRLLKEELNATVGRNDRLITLVVSASTPEQAQAIGSAILEQTYLQSRPKGVLRERIGVQLAEAQGRKRSAENAAVGLIKRMESPVASAVMISPDLARGYADLLNTAAAAQKLVGELESQLDGVSQAQLVQAPTLPEKAVEPKKALLAIGASLAAGLMLLVFVFIRQALRKSAADAESAEKLERIRRVLGLKNFII